MFCSIENLPSRPEGRRPAQAGREGILKQRDLFERSEIEVRCSRCEAPKPTITYYNDKSSNNDGIWPDNLTDGTEDANHNGRIDGDNGDGEFYIDGDSESGLRDSIT